MSVLLAVQWALVCCHCCHEVQRVGSQPSLTAGLLPASPQRMCIWQQQDRCDCTDHSIGRPQSWAVLQISCAQMTACRTKATPPSAPRMTCPPPLALCSRAQSTTALTPPLPASPRAPVRPGMQGQQQRLCICLATMPQVPPMRPRPCQMREDGMAG